MMTKAVSILLSIIIIIMTFAVPLAQPAKAVAGTIIVGAVIAVMALAGITITTSGYTSAQLQGWVSDKLDAWANHVGSPLENLISMPGIGMTVNGLLTLNTAAAQGVNDFIDWLKGNLGLQDMSSKPIIYTDTVNGYTVYKTHSFTENWPNGSITVTNQNDYLYIWRDSSNRNKYTIVSPSQITYTIQGQSLGINLSLNRNGWYGGDLWNETNNQSIPVHALNAIQMADIAAPSANSIQSQVNIGIDTGVITIPTVGNDEKYFIDVGSAAGDTIDTTADNILDEVIAGQLTVSGEVSDTEPSEITGPVSVSGLDDVFPFCIPFDLYHMCEALAADPVAPFFNWRFYLPDVVDYTITIDLSGFDTVAAILRIMETLLFCVGLAFETRKLLRS